jgi:beta-hydroxyacyl-ACP dehydratase FabZ
MFMLELNEILKILPHRFPFLLVDRIIELEPGKRAVGIKNVTFNEWFFQGHFPNDPIMPGVLIMEAMAQVGGVLLMTSTGNEGKTALFGGVHRFRFRRAVRPGDQLVTEVELLKWKGNAGKVNVVGKVDGQVVAEGEYLFTLVEKEEAEGIFRLPASYQESVAK